MASKKKLRASSAVKAPRNTTRQPTDAEGRPSARSTHTRAETRDVAAAAHRHADRRDRQQRGKGDTTSHAQQPTTTTEPAPPFPRQHQPHPGLEANIAPRPRYEAPSYKAAGKLEGKAALVTGGDSGIGRAVATLYAREGADVAIVYLPSEEEDARETERAIEKEGRRALLIPGDVTDPEFCRAAVAQVVSTFGKLDLLVNNAGFQQHQQSLADISDDQWDLTFRTNIFGYFYMAKAALPHLERGAAIVNTGSITGLDGDKDLIDYASTKGAIHAFTKSLAQNLVDRGIRVNAVAPGPVWTPLNIVDKPPRKAAEHGAHTPMHRPAQPEEIAPAYVYFASEGDSSYVTGEIITLLGGYTTAG